MDDSVRSKAEQLAGEIANQARTVEDLNSLMRLMMKSALERMLDTEMDVHLGRTLVGGEGHSEAASTRVLSRPDEAATKRAPNRRNGRSRL